jgi:hypothetical protein
MSKDEIVLVGNFRIHTRLEDCEGSLILHRGLHSWRLAPFKDREFGRAKLIEERYQGHPKPVLV